MTKLAYQYEKKITALKNTEWRALQKSAKRKGDSAKQKEQIFVKKLDDLFDTSHVNALGLITNEDDKQFLVNQKQKVVQGL